MELQERISLILFLKTLSKLFCIRIIVWPSRDHARSHFDTLGLFAAFETLFQISFRIVSIFLQIVRAIFALPPNTAMIRHVWRSWRGIPMDTIRTGSSSPNTTLPVVCPPFVCCRRTDAPGDSWSVQWLCVYNVVSSRHCLY